MDVPHALELADVSVVDLGERRVALIRDRAAVRDPVSPGRLESAVAEKAGEALELLVPPLVLLSPPAHPAARTATAATSVTMNTVVSVLI
jgi:hypothetical protein